MKPRILVASFTELARDPRAKKQIAAALELGGVTTCSFGPAPHPDVTHLELDPNGTYATSWIMQQLDTAARIAGVFAWTYRRIPYVRQARELLAGREFDAIIVNNPDAARVVAQAVTAAPTHVDLHEYFPGLVLDDGSKAARRQQRYLVWLLGGVSASSSSTVARSIAERYREYGLAPSVITNAGPSVDLAPSANTGPIRLVHSGNAQPGRGLSELVRAVSRSDADVTLDLYLVPNDVAFHAGLRELVAESAERVTLHHPVAQDRIVPTLHAYDVGVFVLPPTTVNSELALPNKFFDFVQARLAIVTGPSPEMAAVVRERSLGWVTAGFTEDDTLAALDALRRPEVDRGKQASAAVAVELSGDRHVADWRAIIEALLA